MNLNAKCKICRRAGVKLFLKGERCMSPKCAMIKKPYPPGQKAKARRVSISEYGKELKEKQKLKNWYNLKETQFRKYVKDILNKKSRKEDASVLLIQKLEKRLDNVIFRLGFAVSRIQARQLLTHKHFLVNGKSNNLPGYQVKKGDQINIRPSSLKKPVFQNLSNNIKKYQAPVWLDLDIKKIQGKVVEEPSLDDAGAPVEMSAIFEYYSK
ncbi:30S ribosomal protein S4 [Candidatus Parcubacteria bacterium]|nr:30S ribosomal protein S4 [Candidatus Parcubacteria bacterium]